MRGLDINGDGHRWVGLGGLVGWRKGWLRHSHAVVLTAEKRYGVVAEPAGTTATIKETSGTNSHSVTTSAALKDLRHSSPW